MQRHNILFWKWTARQSKNCKWEPVVWTSRIISATHFRVCFYFGCCHWMYNSTCCVICIILLGVCFWYPQIKYDAYSENPSKITKSIHLGHFYGWAVLWCPAAAVFIVGSTTHSRNILAFSFQRCSSFVSLPPDMNVFVNVKKKSQRPSSLNVCHFVCIIINDASCQEIRRIAVIISANCKSKFVIGHVGQPVRQPPTKFVVTEPALIKKDTWGHIQLWFWRPKLDIFTGDLWDTSGCLCGNQTRYFKPNH